MSLSHCIKKTLLFLLLLPFLSCEKKEPPSRADVLVNIAPYAYFVEKIAGPTLTVTMLIPAGVNAHLYEPTPQQVAAALESTVWFRLGESQEHKILKILKEHNPTLVEVDLCSGISLLSTGEHACSAEKGGHHHTHEGKDRHVWLSPYLAQYQVKKIAATLIKLYPEHRQLFLRNTKTFLAELQHLHEELEEELRPFEGQALLVSHPAFGYFCREFRLRQLSVECEGKDPRPQDVARTLKEAQQMHVRSVFTQAGYNNKGAELIGENLHLPIYLVDPYAQDYLANLREIGHLITQ